MKRKDIFQGIISTMQRELPFPVLRCNLKLPVDSGQMVYDGLTVNVEPTWKWLASNNPL